MTDRWHLYTDGAAAAGAAAVRGARHPGGYAAIVEHGSDGYVIRGRDQETTNTRMELVAVIRGLDSLGDGAHVSVHTDCSAVFVIRYRQTRGTPVALRKSGHPVHDHDLWEQLAGEFDRMASVELVRIPAGGDPRHRRAHVIAGTEAKAAAAGLPADTTMLSKPERRQMIRENRRLHRASMTRVEEAFGEAMQRKRKSA